MANGRPLKLPKPKSPGSTPLPPSDFVGAPKGGTRVDPPQRRAEDDLYERKDAPASQPEPPAAPTSTALGLGQRMAMFWGRHPVAVAAIVAAAMLPGLVGTPLVGPKAPEPTAITAPLVAPHAAQREAAQAALRAPLPLAESTAYLEHRAELRAELERLGLPTRADGVGVRVVSDESSRAEQLTRLIAQPGAGFAIGAEVMLFADAGPVYSARHQALLDRVTSVHAEIEAGARPPADWLPTVAATALFTSAELVHESAQRVGGGAARTELLLLDRAHSPRSLAEAVIVHLERAPSGSEAHAYLQGLGPDRATQREALAKALLEATDTERGGRIPREGKRALEKELRAAREAGFLVMKPAGDSGRELDPLRTRLSRDLADGSQWALVIGAASLPAEGHTPVPLSENGGGWLQLSAPGQGLPAAGGLPATHGASAYAAGVAALMLKVLPGLSPDQLEALLTDPRGLLDHPGPRDGLGSVDVVALVSLAREAQLGQVRFAADPARFDFEKAMKGGVLPAADHPYRVHLEHLRAELAARGLPTRADGVKVIVIEPTWGEHAGGVVRVIADERVGLAPGADVLLWTDSPWYDDREKSLTQASVKHADEVLAGARPEDAVIIEEAERMILGRAADIRRAAEFASGEETVLLNMSYGTTSATIAGNLLDRLRDAPEGSAAAQYLAELGATKDAQLESLVRSVAKVLESPEARAQLESAQESLAHELRAARDKRVLAFTSAGNSRETWMDRRSQSEHVEAGQSELLTIAATSIGDPRILTDDRVTDFSSDGHVFLSAPGEGMPVGLFGDVKGTSFAGPYSVATAALMLAAHPELTPDQLELLLFHPKVTHDLPGHLDGLGALDVVAAVSLAASAKDPGFEFVGAGADRAEFKRQRLGEARGDAVPSEVVSPRRPPRS